MVIVGAGEAGARAAMELRIQGWRDPITLIGEEPFTPYERPPLSKRLLVHASQPAPVTVLGEGALSEYGITLVTGCRVMRIHRERHVVEIDDGRRFAYERLLLATGARPRPLVLQGSGTVPLLYLRTYDDLLVLRARLERGRRVAVIGGGFIGLEIAASAVERGCEVTVIEVAPRILMRGVPEDQANRIESRHRAAGVSFRVGTALTGLERVGYETRIAAADGTSLTCDEVIVGIGAVPETTLAAKAGLEVENGVRVDETLATNDPDVFAAGDCCSFPHPLFGGRRIRLEAWRNAQDQAMHVARSMLGAKDAYQAVPWFWSDQYELTLQVAGLADFGSRKTERALPDGGLLSFHLTEEGRLVSVCGISPSPSLAKAVRVGEMLIERRATPSIATLADPSVNLKSLL